MSEVTTITITIANMVVATSLTGNEMIPIDVPNGDGTYTTKRVSVATLAAYILALPH